MSAYSEFRQNAPTSTATWLVTGAAGFIGSHLVETLLQLNQKVTGLDNFATGYKKNLELVTAKLTHEQVKNFTFIEGDIRDVAVCKEACTGIEYVLHQAALGSVPRSIKDPLTSSAVNIDGFLNMLVAAKDAEVRRFVYASSSSVYGDAEGLPKIEAVTGNPLSPYAVTKAVNELYAGVFYAIYGIQTIGLRYFNVFGPRQDPAGAYAAVIPRWIGELLAGTQPVVFGDGKTSRDFCYVRNAVQANLLAAITDTEEAIGKNFNVSFGDQTSLNELYQELSTRLATLTGKTFPATPGYTDFRSGDVRHSKADISLAKELLGYEPEFSLAAGLSEALEWYVANLSSSS